VVGSDTERKMIQGINPTEPQIIPFEPQPANALKRASRREEFGHRTFEQFDQLSSLLLCLHRYRCWPTLRST